MTEHENGTDDRSLHQEAENSFNLPEDIDSPFLHQLPDELYTLILTKTADFAPRHFITVCENLIKNPNITSSCVFRADIYYDSATQAPKGCLVHESGHSNGELHETYEHATKHLKQEYKPRALAGLKKEYVLERTLVRKMVPRNPQLDDALIQTCLFYAKRGLQTAREDDVEEDNILVMIPHATEPDSIPFYHPSVRALALRYNFWPSPSPKGTLSIYYKLFPTRTLTTRLHRTALNLLTILHKHALGQSQGYTKRVHHDLIIPQTRFQNTYTRLKLTYAKSLIGDWAEQTDPTKHVFEDLGIAAFLAELWGDMYLKGEFPGFVDIGCGNGVLTSILIQEGWTGWGFDARARKSWDTFPLEVRDRISARILAPCVLKIASESGTEGLRGTGAFHDGRFPPGTFIVSNHADELTPWTPFLAYLNEASFVAIPCCSHNLAGARCRFSGKPRAVDGINDLNQPMADMKVSATDGPGPKSGSLAKPKNGAKQPSAYQALTTYVTSLAEELGFEVQHEMLRIPSTRNAAIVGKVSRTHPVQLEGPEARLKRVLGIVKREVGEMDQVVKDWLSQAEKISKKPSGH